jgi:hypothetical protein
LNEKRREPNTSNLLASVNRQLVKKEVDLLENFVVEIFDRKYATSFGVSSNIYSLGNLLGLLRTGSLMRLASTP